LLVSYSFFRAWKGLVFDGIDIFAANVKQVLTILCAVALFNLTITPTNALGIVLTLIGGAIYTAVELRESRNVGG
jgi:hypothetical protein